MSRLPNSITIENVNEVKELILADIKNQPIIELNFEDVSNIDICGIQLVISSLLLCDREKKEVLCLNYVDTIIPSIKKNGFENERTISRYLKGE